MHFIILSDLKKTTVVVESLSTTSTRCSVTEITSLLQDSTNRIRNLHQINDFEKIRVHFNASEMEKMSILSNIINYVQEKRNPIDYYKLDVQALEPKDQKGIYEQ